MTRLVIPIFPDTRLLEANSLCFAKEEEGKIKKAIRLHEFSDPEVMRLEEVPDPQLDAEQVLIKVHAVGVNPVDTYIFMIHEFPHSFVQNSLSLESLMLTSFP